jgi:energy-coupling factor transporter ATP-binding protein EcfA2
VTSDARKHEERKRVFSVESSSEAERTAFQQGSKGIERIEIRNFKAIRSIDLDFPQAEDRSAWLMLLGENSTGKSSILKAIALAMTGEENANQLGLEKPSLVNYEAAQRGEPCQVAVHLTGIGPIRLRFGADSEHFTVDPPNPKMLLAAYGATRLLPAAAQRESSAKKYVRIKSLFDATAPLNDVERWLERVSEEAFADFRERALLLLPELTDLRRPGRRVRATLGRRDLCLHDLSDGYQSLLALLGDIAITVSDYWRSLKIAEGLVLLDEIETHLHPRWKISIVERLRAACPQMTFIVTSHDPLCLKGLQNDEIAVLRRDQSDAVALERNTMSVTHLRWDEILASFLFNLPSTRDSSTPALVARYSHLLGKRVKTPEEQDEFSRLRLEVKKQFSSAMTPMQKNVEEALARTLRAGRVDTDHDDVRLEMRHQVAEIIDREDTRQ